MQQKTYVMLNKIKLPFGYNILQIASVSVYTGQIRVTTDMETVNDFISMEDRHNGVSTGNGKNMTVIISWATTDRTTHQELISKMNRLLAYVMHKRVAVKYGELVEQVPDLAW